MASGGRRPNAGRKPGFTHSEVTRNRIRTAMLVNRLQNFVLGQIQMSASQVQAAIGLLRKTLPDLQSIEHLGELTADVHLVSAEPLTEDEWQRTYGEPRRH